MMERVGLTKRSGHPPSRLPAGEVAAIARLVQPALVLADELTGNVNETGRRILALLLDVLASGGGAAARDEAPPEHAARFERVEFLKDGVLAPGKASGRCMPEAVHDRLRSLGIWMCCRLLFARCSSAGGALDEEPAGGSVRHVRRGARGRAGAATVVLVLDTNTRAVEARSWQLNPDLDVRSTTVSLQGVRADGTPIPAADAKTETHEDYVVMRSAIRMGSLSAYLVGALIVFFTFAAVIERKKREVALYRSLGALPEQVAAVFVREAVIIAALGALLGVLAAVPLSVVAGMTTTGRARIRLGEMTWPFARMAIAAHRRGWTALLGGAAGARDLAAPAGGRAVGARGGRGGVGATRAKGDRADQPPFMALLFVLMRPFFKSAAVAGVLRDRGGGGARSRWRRWCSCRMWLRRWGLIARRCRGARRRCGGSSWCGGFARRAGASWGCLSRGSCWCSRCCRFTSPYSRSSAR
ncbi:MAG: FtsX-like permease family protein [Polyangiaceae bacterium]